MLKPILFMISETSLATLPGVCSHQGVFPIPFYTMHSSTVKEKNQMVDLWAMYEELADLSEYRPEEESANHPYALDLR